MKASRPSQSKTAAVVTGDVIHGLLTIAEITQARAVTVVVAMPLHRLLAAEIKVNVHAGLLKFSLNV